MIDKPTYLYPWYMRTQHSSFFGAVQIISYTCHDNTHNLAIPGKECSKRGYVPIVYRDSIDDFRNCIFILRNTVYVSTDGSNLASCGLVFPRVRSLDSGTAAHSIDV